MIKWEFSLNVSPKEIHPFPARVVRICIHQCKYSVTAWRFRHIFKNQQFFRVHDPLFIECGPTASGRYVYIFYYVYNGKRFKRSRAPVDAMSLCFRIFVEDPRGKRALDDDGGGRHRTRWEIRGILTRPRNGLDPKESRDGLTSKIIQTHFISSERSSDLMA